MWKKVGLTKHAKYAKRTPALNQGRKTTWEDMFM